MRLIQKKGDPTDIILLVIFLFVFAVSFLVYYYFTGVTADALSNSPLNITETQGGIQTLRDLGSQGASQGFLMIFLALLLGMMITSFLVRIHPIFLVVYILVLAINIFVAVVMGNSYHLITSQEPFTTLAANQPIIVTFMNNIVLITLVSGVLSMIVVFAKVFGPGDQP
jgi:hypothetical protein